MELEGLILTAQEAEKTKDFTQNEFERVSQESRELEDKVNVAYRELSDYKTKLSEAQLALSELKMKEQSDQRTQAALNALEEKNNEIFEDFFYKMEKMEGEI